MNNEKNAAIENCIKKELAAYTAKVMLNEYTRIRHITSDVGLAVGKAIALSKAFANIKHDTAAKIILQHYNENDLEVISYVAWFAIAETVNEIK